MIWKSGLVVLMVLLLNFFGFSLKGHSDTSIKPESLRQIAGRSAKAEPFRKDKSALDLYPRKILMQTLNSRPADTGGSWACLPFSLDDVNSAVLPSGLDWRALGGVTPIDNQGDNGCGGCWVYAATAVFESLIKIRTQRDIDLSEEQISSCLRNGNNTGIAWQAFNYIQANGVTTEEHIACDYSFPVCDYEENDDYFYLNDHWILSLYEFSLEDRVKIMKYAIQNFGPVAGGFIVYEDWWIYQSGIYIHDPQSPYLGHHSIAIVGWADDASLPNGGYWIVKNDLSAEWGEDGYFRIGYGECDIDEAFMFAHWNPDTPAPVFATKVGTRYFTAGDTIELDISARVPEGHSPGYQAVGLPEGADYDENTGLFTWTPEDSQTGVHEIEFFAYYDIYTSSQTGFLCVVSRR